MPTSLSPSLQSGAKRMKLNASCKSWGSNSVKRKPDLRVVSKKFVPHLTVGIHLSKPWAVCQGSRGGQMEKKWRCDSKGGIKRMDWWEESYESLCKEKRLEVVGQEDGNRSWGKTPPKLSNTVIWIAESRTYKLIVLRSWGLIFQEGGHNLAWNQLKFGFKCRVLHNVNTLENQAITILNEI